MTGELVDHYFLTAVAKTNNRDIIIIPSFQASCTHPPSNPFMQRIYGGLPTNERQEVSGQFPPLFLGYLEDNLYTCGHFQAVEFDPDSSISVVQEYLRGRTNIDMTTSIPTVSAIFPERHVPMVNMPDSLVNMVLHNLNSISNESSVLQSGFVGPQNPRTTLWSIRDYSAFQSPIMSMSSPARSTKRRREDEEGRVSKKSREDFCGSKTTTSKTTNETDCSRSEKSTCHICNQIFRKNIRNSYCTYCRKKIHKNCQKSSCPFNV